VEFALDRSTRQGNASVQPGEITDDPGPMPNATKKLSHRRALGVADFEQRKPAGGKDRPDPGG